MKVKTTFLLLLGSLLFYTGCSEQPAPGAASSVSLNQVRTFPLIETDSLFIGDFTALSISEDPYELFIPDHVQKTVVVADTLGNLLRTIGRAGEGPGELPSVYHALVVEDMVYVRGRFRYTLFKTSGEFVENRTRPEGVFEEGMWAIKFFNDHFYIGGIDSRTSGVQAQATAEDRGLSIRPLTSWRPWGASRRSTRRASTSGDDAIWTFPQTGLWRLFLNWCRTSTSTI